MSSKNKSSSWGARRRWSENEAREILAALERSELSVAAFAEVHGLTSQRLYWWRRRLATRDHLPVMGDGEDGHVDLVPVRVAEVDGESARRSMDAIVIHLPNGAAVEIPASKSPAWVAAFVRVLEDA